MTQTTQTTQTTHNITAKEETRQMPNFGNLKKEELIRECEKLFTLNIRNINILRDLLDVKIEKEENFDRYDKSNFALSSYFQNKMLENKFLNNRNLFELNKLEAILLLQIQFMFSKEDATKAFRLNKMRWNNTKMKYIVYFDIFTSCLTNGQIEFYNRLNPSLNIPLNPINTESELDDEYASFC